MNASQTKFQEKEGIKDSNDKFFEETLKAVKEPTIKNYYVILLIIQLKQLIG